MSFRIVFSFIFFVFFFVQQKTAYEMRISDWSSDVCSSDLHAFSSVTPSSRGVRIPVHDQGSLEIDLPSKLDDNGRRALPVVLEIGRASCRERVCKYV